ncbi:hypothetical protein [Brevibacterium permense]|nr:hypothetical protein [Brevibacterium permense]
MRPSTDDSYPAEAAVARNVTAGIADNEDFDDDARIVDNTEFDDNEGLRP